MEFLWDLWMYWSLSPQYSCSTSIKVSARALSSRGEVLKKKRHSEQCCSWLKPWCGWTWVRKCSPIHTIINRIFHWLNHLNALTLFSILNADQTWCLFVFNIYSWWFSLFHVQSWWYHNEHFVNYTWKIWELSRSFSWKLGRSSCNLDLLQNHNAKTNLLNTAMIVLEEERSEFQWDYNFAWNKVHNIQVCSRF